MIDDITAAAPRFILRLICLHKLFDRYIGKSSAAELACEIGPGLGDAASFLMREGYAHQCHLFEGSEAALSLVRERFSENPAITTKSEFSGESTKGELYDLILCCEVIEHIDADVNFMRLIESRLKKEGILIGSVPAFQKKWQSVDELAGHYRRYERAELHEKLESAGLNVREIRCYGFPLINLLYPLRERYYKRQLLKNSRSTKDEATARSGIARSFSRKFNKTGIFRITWLFSWLQSLPYLSEFGDGYIFVATKATD